MPGGSWHGDEAASQPGFAVAATRPPRLPRVKAIVYVGDGAVARVRAVDPDLAKRKSDDRGNADVPSGRR
ncbi:hypothetical protein ACQPZA_13555 [Pseudonocardia xinjiangensis]|uniref:hypothetical protein n=1 Tax=Pseudonocardia xinjiangensis TaxID=75289 RepID=UPI003D940B03